MGNSEKKNFDRRKYGLITWKEIYDAFRGVDDGTTIEWKQLMISMAMLFFMLVLQTIMAWIFLPTTSMAIISLVFIVMIMSIYVFNSAVLHEEIGAVSKYTINVLMIIYSIGAFFQTGGLVGGGGVWFIFLITFTAVSLQKKQRVACLVIEVMLFFTAMHIGSTHPEYVRHLPDDINLLFHIVSIVEITIFIAIVIVFQSRASRLENEKNQVLQKQLKEKNDQLYEALTAQKMFTASMNHELRAPLNGVMGGIRVLLGSDNLDRSQMALLNASYHSANALVHIVNDLLDYAKIEAGEFQIIKEDFNIRQIAQESAMLMSNMTREKGLTFETVIAPDVPEMLHADGTRIQQVISNLISNAVKYTFKGGITFGISLENDNLLVISVADTGEGISDEAKEVLFTPFKRINEGEHKKIQGTGLGLYVTHNLVTQMGGTIDVESEVGVGTTFTVTIPVEKAKHEAVQGEKIGKNVDIDFGNLKLLCVDDSEINLIVFEKLIGKITHAEITTVDSGKKALELLKDHSYDIIYIDSMMPEMSGIETLHNIREMNIMTPAVVVTGEVGKDNEQRFRDAGFSGYVSKPMKVDEVMKTIGMLANKKEMH